MTDLFLEDRVVSVCILGIAVPAPVHYHHTQGGGQEHYDEDAGPRVAAIQQTEHGQQQQQAQEDIQVSGNIEYWFYYSIIIMFKL